MKYLLSIYVLMFGCSTKVIQKPQKNVDLGSQQNENNVLYITNELQKHDFQGPLFWFSIILIIVMLLSYSCSILKNE